MDICSMYTDCDVVGKLGVRQGIEEKYFFLGLTYILQFQFLKVCHLNVINSTVFQFHKFGTI